MIDITIGNSYIVAIIANRSHNSNMYVITYNNPSTFRLEHQFFDVILWCQEMRAAAAEAAKLAVSW